ncbi:hypothetical protein LTR65_004997 [Meristemomyces frigidus]
MCLHCNTNSHPFNFCPDMPRDQYARTGVPDVQGELERAKVQVEDDLNELPRRTIADLVYERYYHELADKQQNDYRQQMLESETGVREAEEHAIIAANGQYGGENTSRGDGSKAVEEEDGESDEPQRLVPWREPGTIQFETFDYAQMFQNMREKAALDADHERREDIKLMSRALPSHAHPAGVRNNQRVFGRINGLTRKTSPLGTPQQQKKPKKPRSEEYQPQDALLRNEEPLGFKRNADAPRPISRHLYTGPIDPRPGAATQRVDDERFQALYEIFKKQMGEAASRSLPKGFSRNSGYRGARWRYSKADHANSRPGEAFLAGIAILLGHNSKVSNDDPHRIDTQWGPVLIKVRIVIVIAVSFLKKYVQFFNQRFETQASTRSPWDPVIVRGFNYDNTDKSVADITKLYRVDFDQQMLHIGCVERPGLKQILQIIDGPDGALGMTSAKIKDSLAAIDTDEANERAAAMPRARHAVALPDAHGLVSAIAAVARPVNTATAGPPLCGLDFVSNEPDGRGAAQSPTQPTTDAAAAGRPPGSPMVPAGMQIATPAGRAGQAVPLSTTNALRRQMNDLNSDRNCRH